MQKIRKGAGGALGGLGCALYGLWGLVSTAVNLFIVMEGTGWGFFAVVLGIFFFPVTLVAAPWYALVAWGNPIPLGVTYGGLILVIIVGWLGGLIGGDE